MGTLAVALLVIAAVLIYVFVIRKKATPKPVPVIVEPPVIVPSTEIQQFYICEQKELGVISNNAYEIVYSKNMFKGETVYEDKAATVPFNGQGKWWSSEGETIFYRIGGDGLIDAEVKI